MPDGFRSPGGGPGRPPGGGPGGGPGMPGPGPWPGPRPGPWPGPRPGPWPGPRPGPWPGPWIGPRPWPIVPSGPRCDWVDQFGRCCYRNGWCCDSFGRCEFVGGIGSPVASRSGSTTGWYGVPGGWYPRGYDDDDFDD